MPEDPGQMLSNVLVKIISNLQIPPRETIKQGWGWINVFQTDKISMVLLFTHPFLGGYRKRHTFRISKQTKKDKIWDLT